MDERRVRREIGCDGIELMGLADSGTAFCPASELLGPAAAGRPSRRPFTALYGRPCADTRGACVLRGWLAHPPAGDRGP